MSKEREEIERLLDEYVAARDFEVGPVHASARSSLLSAISRLLAERDGLRKAIEPYLGDSECSHDRVHNHNVGRVDHNIRGTVTCGECGADMHFVETLAAIDAALRGET